MANTHPAERQRTLGVGDRSQVPAPPRQPFPPLGVHGRSPRATGHLTARLLERQCCRVQDGMREEARELIAAAGAHPQAATAYLGVDPRGPREVVTRRPAPAKMPAPCARQPTATAHAQ